MPITRNLDLDPRASLEALMQRLRAENDARIDQAISAASRPAPMQAKLQTEEEKKKSA